MSMMAAALQPHTVGGLISLGGRSALGGLSDLLIDARSSYDLDFNDTDESILVDFRDTRLIVPALGADSSRFATAAFQSIAPTVKEIIEKDTLAWSIVKLYYAAFYAGHSIIRMLGESCSFLERSHTSRISELGVAMGKQRSFRIDRGLYHCSANSTASALKYVKARDGMGGAHESFWSIFQSRVHDLSRSVLAGNLVPAEAQQVFAQFEYFERILDMAGPGMHGALSIVRNDLQYKHKFGVWYPVQLGKREREALGRLAAQWQRDPMDIDLQLAGGEVLPKFVLACVFIVGLCRAMLFRIAEISTEGSRCFVCYGPLSFLRSAGLKAQLQGGR